MLSAGSPETTSHLTCDQFTPHMRSLHTSPADSFLTTSHLTCVPTCDHLTAHLRVHLRGEHLGELGDEVVHQLVALLGDDVDGDQVAGALQHFLQLLLSSTETHVSRNQHTGRGRLLDTDVFIVDAGGVIRHIRGCFGGTSEKCS